MYKQRLKEYIAEDFIYQDYKRNDELTEINDFDDFCIGHCQDIQDLLDENECLRGQIDYLRKSCERKEETIALEQSERAELEGKIDKAIEYINIVAIATNKPQYFQKIKDTIWGEELLEILKE